MHGHIDKGLAGVTAVVPRLMRFGDEREARFFEIEALANTAIAGLTDFDYYEHPSPRRLRRSEREDAALDAGATALGRQPNLPGRAITPLGD